MVIIHSDRFGLTNFDNVYSVTVSGRYIHAQMKDGRKHSIAAYKDAERAEEVFIEMMDALFPEEETYTFDTDKLMPFIEATPPDFIEDVHVFEVPKQYYYMPEE